MKVGIIGCGKIAEKHINAYKKMADVEIFVHDKDTRKKRVAKSHGIQWVGRDTDILKDDTVDIVDVCIPTPHHCKIINRALDCGKHVFCEKPLTLSMAEAREIEKKARRAKRHVEIGYLYKFHPGYRQIREVLREGIIGVPHYAIFRLGGRGSHKLWKHKKKKGGGVVGEVLVHMMDLIMWFFSGITNIEVLHKGILLKRRKIEGKTRCTDADDIMLLKVTAADIQIYSQCDLVSPSYMNYAEIHGREGSVWTSILDFFPTMVYCKRPAGMYDIGHNLFRYPKIDLFYEELRCFLNEVRKNEYDNPTGSIRRSISMLQLLKKASLV